MPLLLVLRVWVRGFHVSCPLTQRTETKAHIDCEVSRKLYLEQIYLSCRPEYTTKEQQAFHEQESAQGPQCYLGLLGRIQEKEKLGSYRAQWEWFSVLIDRLCHVIILKLCVSLLRMYLVYLYTHPICIGTRFFLGDLLEILKGKSLTSMVWWVFTWKPSAGWAEAGHACPDPKESSKPV